jgi:hypothetical protein
MHFLATSEVFRKEKIWFFVLSFVNSFGRGGVAQLGERLLCTQEVIGSIPFTSTNDLKIKGGEKIRVEQK